MSKMQKALPEHFAYVPRSWSLKSEKQNFQKFFSGMTYANGSIIQDKGEESTSAASAALGLRHISAKQVFIMKPNAGCQGRGIILTKDPLSEVDNPEDYVVQEYIARPLLIEGRKFDLRVYCLVTSLKYPSIFVYNDGLVRLCAEAYEKPSQSNMDNACKHLTNYAVNKKSAAYQKASSEGEDGSKRDFIWFNKWLDETLSDEMLSSMHKAKSTAAPSEGGAGVSPTTSSNPNRSATLWSAIDHIIVKTVLSAQPKVRHAYNGLFPHGNDGYTCFEVLGFDILIDHKLQPWLMEVNHTPSFATDSPLDRRVKENLITEVLSVINPTTKDKQKSAEKAKAATLQRINGSVASMEQSTEYHILHEQLEDTRIVNFRRVYPVPNYNSTAPKTSTAAPKKSDNLIPTPQKNSDINDRIAAQLGPVEIEMRKLVYEEVLQFAINTNIAPTTASQEQRQNEIRQQRQKREAEAQLLAQKTQRRAASKGPTPSTGPLPALKGDSNAQWPPSTPTPMLRAQSASSHSFRREESKPESAASNSNNNSKSAVENLKHTPVAEATGGITSSKRIENEIPIRGPKEIEVATLAANGVSTGNASSKRPVPAPPPPREDLPVTDERNAAEKKRRQRLEEQMAKHRRRMELGPRVSVFQLREASAYVNEGIIPSTNQAQNWVEPSTGRNRPQEQFSNDINLSLQGLLLQAQTSRGKVLSAENTSKNITSVPSSHTGLLSSSSNSLQKMNIVGRHVAPPTISTIRTEADKPLLSDGEDDEIHNYEDDGDDDDDERYRYRGYEGRTAEEKRVLRRFYALRRSMQFEEEEE